MTSINGLNNLPQDIITGSGSDTVQAEQSQDNSIFVNILNGEDDAPIVDDGVWRSWEDEREPVEIRTLPYIITVDDEPPSGFKELC